MKKKPNFKDQYIDRFKKEEPKESSLGIKLYHCSLCDYYGTRQMVRKHLREEHGIRGLAKDMKGQREESQLTASTIVKDFN